jgi:hypothetical protein
MRMRRLWYVIVFLLFASLQTAVAWEIDPRALVYIEVGFPKTDKTIFGTGFYLKGVGIVTAYHVIQRANRIKVYRNNGNGKVTLIDSLDGNIKVHAYAAMYDLAILYLKNGTSKTQLEKYKSPASVRSTDTVTVAGHPRGMANQEISGRTTHDGFIPSKSVNDAKTRASVFQADINLFQLDILSDYGMSGGPVVVRKRVIGVFIASISADPVRTFSYAIPISYLNTKNRAFLVVNKAPEGINDWGQLTLVEHGEVFLKASDVIADLQLNFVSRTEKGLVIAMQNNGPMTARSVSVSIIGQEIGPPDPRNQNSSAVYELSLSGLKVLNPGQSSLYIYECPAEHLFFISEIRIIAEGSTDPTPANNNYKFDLVNRLITSQWSPPPIIEWAWIPPERNPPRPPVKM